jgi:RNA polymerase sigma factor (sigma-70 family)
MTQDEQYLRAVAEFGPALVRLARTYEADADQRRDLLQDVYLALWRSFAGYAGQCSLRTWVYRVAHNTAISARLRRRNARLVSLEELADMAAAEDPEEAVGNARVLARLQILIRRLAPPPGRPGDAALPRRPGRGVDRRDHRPLGGRRRDPHPPRQAAALEPVPAGRGPMTDVKTVWKTQFSEVNAMSSLAEVRARAAKLQAGIRWRNLALYAYSAFSILVSAWLIARGAFPAMRYPMLLMVAAHLLVLWQINHRITARRLPADMAARPAIDFLRQQLERQAHGLSRAWLWYMLPFLVPFVWELGIMLHRIHTGEAPPQSPRLFAVFVVTGILFWTAVLLAFSRAALKAHLQIDRLDAVKSE